MTPIGSWSVEENRTPFRLLLLPEEVARSAQQGLCAGCKVLDAAVDTHFNEPRIPGYKKSVQCSREGSMIVIFEGLGEGVVHICPQEHVVPSAFPLALATSSQANYSERPTSLAGTSLCTGTYTGHHELQIDIQDMNPKKPRWFWSPDVSTRRRPVSEEPLSDDFLLTINQWVELCDSFHPKCHPRCTALLPHQMVNAIPDRLLDIRSAGTNSVKLILTHGKEIDYMALSYCWGTGPIVKTTSQTSR